MQFLVNTCLGGATEMVWLSRSLDMSYDIIRWRWIGNVKLGNL